MTERRKLRVEPSTLPEADQAALEEISALPRLARALRRLTIDGGAVPADSKRVEAALRAAGEEPLEVLPEHLDALVALGTVERVMIGTTLHLVWRSEGTGVSPHLPRTVSQSPPTTDEDREFRLDVALDLERERVLFYRVLLVIEGLVGALLLRQILLWYVFG